GVGSNTMLPERALPPVLPLPAPCSARRLIEESHGSLNFEATIGLHLDRGTRAEPEPGSTGAPRSSRFVTESANRESRAVPRPSLARSNLCESERHALFAAVDGLEEGREAADVGLLVLPHRPVAALDAQADAAVLDLRPHPAHVF